ncbi:MAG TPA: serpin family protein, partial [bacterium]|nr:serpin family protein [bacterium]
MIRIPLFIGISMMICAVPLNAMQHGAHAGDDAQTVSDDAPVPEVQMALAKANNQFGVALYRELSRTDDSNLFLAPYSVSSALAMTWAGARGETSSEMASVLGFTPEAFNPHDGFSGLNQSLEDQEHVIMNVANSLWPAKQFTLDTAYQDLMKQYYGVDITALDYAGETESSRQRINTWVETETREKIKDLITPGALDPTTVLVLVNAIYFKGDWMAKFDPDRTVDGVFHCSDGNEKTVPMMRQKKEFKYTEIEDLKILEMPYAGDRLAMTVILPQDMNTFKAVEQALTPGKLDRWLSQMRTVEVDVTLPKFKMIWGATDITNALKSMGMVRAFSGRADFTGITPDGGIHIDMVLHKTYIEVNEEGSEAAGATAVILRKTAMMPR